MSSICWIFDKVIAVDPVPQSALPVILSVESPIESFLGRRA